jgi:hypothetical protein
MLSTPMQWRHKKLAVVLFLFTIAQLQSIGLELRNLPIILQMEFCIDV